MKIRKLKQKQILPSKRIAHAIAKRADFDWSKGICISIEKNETSEEFESRLLKFFGLWREVPELDADTVELFSGIEMMAITEQKSICELTILGEINEKEKTKKTIKQT